ncbi:hypothetical protein [Rhizobium sp. Rhizsp82]|uniref:hypothetical protein n=1 Tax=Rhizobium sp. Rhizsp82 TaxID=3243057 RepID=UPI0039B55EEF
MTKPATKLHPMIVQAATNADLRRVQIDAVAAHLADLMREVHGGDWRIQAEHELHFIVVAMKPSRARS